MKKISLLFIFIIVAVYLCPYEDIKVEGRVVSGDDSTPLSGVRIQAQYHRCYCLESPEDFLKETISQQDGSFILLLPKGDRDYTIFLSYPKEHIFSVYGEISESTDLGTIILPQVCKLQGTVFDNNGNVLPNITLSARIRLKHTECPEYKEVSKTKSDKNGNFSFKNIYPAEYKIRIINVEFAQTEETINVSKNRKHLELFTYKGATIRGRVIDLSDRAVTGILVEVSPFFRSYSDQKGYYRIGGLKTGRCTIHVCGMGYGLPHNKSIHLNLCAGQEITYHIRVVHTGKLRIHIQAEENTFIPDKLVISLDDDKHPRGGYSFLREKVISNTPEFENIVPGSYTLSTKNDEFPEQTAHVTIKSGKLTEQTISIKPSIVFKGKVFKENKKPLFDAKIELRGKSHSINRYGRSDRNGDFTLKGLLPDHYTLKIDHCEAINIEKEIQVEKTNIEPKEFMLKTGATLSGQVLNEDKIPLKNAWIKVIGIMPLDNFNGGKTDEKGIFNISGLKPGKVRIYISEKDSIPISEKIFVKKGTSFKEPFFLRKGLTLHGKLIDEKGKPVRNARISCLKKSVYEDLKSTKTDCQGHFLLKGLLSGAVTIEVEKEEFFPFEKDINSTGEFSHENPLILSIREGLRIAGKVLEADGTVCENMEVNIIGDRMRSSHNWNDSECIIDSRGHFIFRGLPKGLYSLTVTDKNTYNRILTVKDIPAGKEDITIKLPQKHVISGVITDDKATLVSNAKIEVYRLEKGRFKKDFSLDTAGRFQVELRQGFIYLFSFLHDSYLPLNQKVDLTTGPIDTKKVLNINLKSGFSISGTVVRGDDNRPVQNLLVINSKYDHPIIFSDFERKKIAKTNTDGSFVIRGVDSGVNTLYVFKGHEDEIPLAQKQILVEQKDVTNIKIKIKEKETGTISVKIVLENGLPAMGCSLGLISLDGDTPLSNRGKTDENGVYIFNKVLPGRYLVVCFSFNDSSFELIKPVPVTVKKNQTSKVVIGKPNDTEGMSISGKVSKDGQPLKSGHISFFQVKSKKLTKENVLDLMKNIKQGIINKHGKFFIKGIKPGDFVYEIKNIKEENGLSFGGCIEIDNHQKSIDIDIKGIKLTGVVTGSDEQPVSGAMIKVSPVEPNELLKKVLSREHFTDKNGNYEINGIVPGQYDISVEHKKWSYLKKPGINLLKQNEELNFKLSKGFFISGSVKTYDNSIGEGALVLVVDESGNIITLTMASKNGDYQTNTIFPKGRYTIYTYLNGHALDVQSIDITQDQVHDVSLNLGGNLEVVLKGNQEEIVGKNIVVRILQGKVVKRLKINGFMMDDFMMDKVLSFCTIQPTNFEGKTKIYGLKPGIYTVSVEGKPSSKQVKIIALETVTCKLEI